MVYQYRQLYDILRDRIQSGEFALGERVPSISQLQEQYDVASLNTVRAAQQMLVDDGLLRTEQGRGAFVMSTESARAIDPLAALEAASAEITRARKALTSGMTQKVTIDFGDDQVYFVVTDALSTWAAEQRHQAESYEPDAEPDQMRTAWAEVAEGVLAHIEQTLDNKNQAAGA